MYQKVEVRWGARDSPSGKAEHWLKVNNDLMDAMSISETFKGRFRVIDASGAPVGCLYDVLEEAQEHVLRWHGIVEMDVAEHPSSPQSDAAGCVRCGNDRGPLAKWCQHCRDEVGRLKAWVNDLQSGMYINCVYCGHRYGPSDEVPASVVVPPDPESPKGLATGPDVKIDWTMADVLKEHIEQCPKHPLSEAKARIADLELGIELREAGDDWRAAERGQYEARIARIAWLKETAREARAHLVEGDAREALDLINLMLLPEEEST